MIVTHKLHTEIINITSSTAGFDVELKCQAAYIINNGDATATLYFNNDNNNSYIMEPGAMLTMDINYEHEILGDEIKVEFDSGKSPNLKILKQIKSIIQ